MKNMGTNYFLADKLDRKIRHIGKTSNSGLYCYTCNISLVTGMPATLLTEDQRADNPHFRNGPNYKKCPSCGGKYNGSVSEMLELFKLPKNFQRPEQGVNQSYSFTFATKPDAVEKLADDRKVIDEYENKMTMEEMKKIIEGATFKLTHLVGSEFC